MLFKLTDFPKHVFIFEGMKNVQETLGLFGNHGKLQNFNCLHYQIISFSFSLQKKVHEPEFNNVNRDRVFHLHKHQEKRPANICWVCLNPLSNRSQL